MLRTTIQSFLVVTTLIGLSSCAQRPIARLEDARHYSVRSASISGDRGVPAGITLGVQRGIDDAIASTYRSGTDQEVALNARLSAIETTPGPQGPIYVMKINTALTDIRSGQLVSAGEFEVASGERSSRGMEITLRDRAYSQLRYVYGLQAPVARLPRIQQRNTNYATFGPSAPDNNTDTNLEPNIANLTKDQLNERALANPDPVLNSKSQIDTTNDPLLAPGMASAKPDNSIVKPKKNGNATGKATPKTNNGGIDNLTQDANAASTAKPVIETPKADTAPAPEVAKPAPAKKEEPKQPTAKAFSNLENGAATNIVIPSKQDKPAAAAPAASAAPATATKPVADAPATVQPAAAPKTPAPTEPCVVTVSNDCK